KSLDADLVIYAPADNEALKVFASHADCLDTVFITSKVELVRGEAPEGAFKDELSGISVVVKPASGEKCVRCWRSVEEYTVDEDGQHLCCRCKNAVC
ncbi:MAG: hypothetical protein J6T77_05455, partial [Clostridia bacterium]|nr:hypothetical protein [Clostridia bacterium]